MSFLDSSTIIEYLRDNQRVIEYLDDRRLWWTSTICVFEVCKGPAGSTDFDPARVGQQFRGVDALDLNERLALAAGRLQHEAMEAGRELSPRDAMIGATARSAGDDYVVADGGFDVEPLREHMKITNRWDS